MSTRLVNNFIKQQGARVDAVAMRASDLVASDDSLSVALKISPQEALSNIGIAYLRFTGNVADKALVEVICGIAVLLGSIGETNPIGKTNNNQKAVEVLIREYKTATELISPILGYVNALVTSTNPQVKIAGDDFVKCIKAYTELIVYQDRRRITHKDDFLTYINALIYETLNGLPTNPEAIVLTPPPSAPVLPPPIEYSPESAESEKQSGTASRRPREDISTKDVLEVMSTGSPETQPAKNSPPVIQEIQRESLLHETSFSQSSKLREDNESEELERFRSLGKGLLEYTKNWSGGSENETIKRMQALVRDRFEDESRLTSLIDECIRILARTDMIYATHGRVQSAIAWKQMFTERIESVFNEQSIAKAKAFMQGYLGDR